MIWSRMHRERGPLLLSILIGIVCFALIWGARAAGYLQWAELRAYDALLRQQPRDDNMGLHIVVIGVDEGDIQAGSYPVPDDVMAALLNKLTDYGAGSIGVDIYRDKPVGPETARPALIDAFHRSGAVPVMQYGPSGVFIKPPAGVDPEQVGFSDLPKDRDGVIRRGLIAMGKGTDTHFSFALQVAGQDLIQVNKINPDKDPDHPEMIRLGNTTLRPFKSDDGGYVNADAAGYQFLLDYKGADEYRTFTLRQALPEKFKPEDLAGLTAMKPSDVRGKLVLIGMRTDSVKDYLYTPMGRSFGVDTHAMIADQYLRAALEGAQPVAVWAESSKAVWTLGWTVLGAMLAFLVRSPLRFVVATVIAVALLLLCAYGALCAGVWIPSVPPLIGLLLAAIGVTFYLSYHEREDRAALMQLFSRQVSPEVAAALWEHRREILDNGRLRTHSFWATVLFTDLRGFTAFAESMKPDDVMSWLNNYMEQMSALVAKHGGMVNKYTGDGLMAVFQAPLSSNTPEQRQKNAKNAVLCALAMRRAVDDLKAGISQQSGTGAAAKDLCMRVGINSGELVAGSLGSANRQEYTVIGDTVNTASRLESFDKDLMDADIAAGGCRILIGQPTQELLGDPFITRRIGEMTVIGKTKQVEIFGVVGLADSAPPSAPPTPA